MNQPGQRVEVTIGDRLVGDGHPAFIVYEAGATHTGLDSAKGLVEAAAQSGADATKFQTLFVDKLMSSEGVEFDYQTTEGKQTEDLATILRRREMSYEHWWELVRHAQDLGVMFFSTPGDTQSIDFLVEAKTPCIKIMGGDMTHLPFIRYAAETGLPILLDTRGTLGELERAVETCIQAGNEQIVIVYCPSGYPATVEGIRLKTLILYRNIFPYPIGFSDHSPGIDMDVAALALGANFIEKTITLDVHQRSAEHIMSIEPSEMRDFVDRLRTVEVGMGISLWRQLAEQERHGLDKGTPQHHAHPGPCRWGGH